MFFLWHSWFIKWHSLLFKWHNWLFKPACWVTLQKPTVSLEKLTVSLEKPTNSLLKKWHHDCSSDTVCFLSGFLSQIKKSHGLLIKLNKIFVSGTVSLSSDTGCLLSQLTKCYLKIQFDHWKSELCHLNNKQTASSTIDSVTLQLTQFIFQVTKSVF